MSATTLSPESCESVCAPAPAEANRDEVAAQLWEEHGWSLTFRHTAAIVLVAAALSAIFALLG